MDRPQNLGLASSGGVGFRSEFTHGGDIFIGFGYRIPAINGGSEKMGVRRREFLGPFLFCGFLSLYDRGGSIGGISFPNDVPSGKKIFIDGDGTRRTWFWSCCPDGEKLGLNRVGLVSVTSKLSHLIRFLAVFCTEGFECQVSSLLLDSCWGVYICS